MLCFLYHGKQFLPYFFGVALFCFVFLFIFFFFNLATSNLFSISLSLLSAGEERKNGNFSILQGEAGFDFLLPVTKTPFNSGNTWIFGLKQSWVGALALQMFWRSLSSSRREQRLSHRWVQVNFGVVPSRFECGVSQGEGRSYF